MQATLSAVSGKSGFPDIDVIQSWDCLYELLQSDDDEMAATGSEWLYRLLVSAADRHAEAMWEMQASDDGLALLPAVPGSSTSKWKGIAQQPQLSSLLTRVLVSDCHSGVPVHTFLNCVTRLVMYVKVHVGEEMTPATAEHGRCVLQSCCISTDGRSFARCAQLHLSVVSSVLPPFRPAALSTLMHVCVTLHDKLLGVSSVRTNHRYSTLLIFTALHLHRSFSATRVACSVLATLEVAVEWILSAPKPCRQPALKGCCELLLSLLCIPTHLLEQRSNSASGQSATLTPQDGDRGVPAVTPTHDSCGTVAHAFLSGQTSVPHAVLKLVSSMNIVQGMPCLHA